MGLAMGLVALSGSGLGWTTPLLFVLLWMSTVGLIQALTGTCAMAAFRGERVVDAGSENIADPTVRRENRRMAKWGLGTSLAIAGGLTAALNAF